MASVDVNQVVAGIESGSIPEGVGLTALLMQSREQPTQLANHVPILTKRLLDQSKRSDVQSPVLEILAQLLVSPHAEEVAQVLIEDEILSQLLLFLNNNEFGIRYPLLRICISIAKLKRSSLQSAAACSGVAIGQLAAILADSREILRNEAVLLFCELCVDNKDLPVLFAFESGFELIISILDSEGWTDGGIIVLDCLRLATLILDDNTNTQSFFREMGFLHKLLPLFKLSTAHKWDKRRTEIVLMSIRLMLLFVSNSLPANHIITMQNTLESIGLHPSIIRIIRSDQCPDAILASGMILLSKVMTVGTVASCADSGVSLAGLMCSFDGGRDYLVRCAGWLLARSVLAKSASVQKELVFGIMDLKGEPKSYSAYMGRHILHALLAEDEASSWFASTLLARCLQEPQTKEWLLAMKLPIARENDSVEEIALFSLLCTRLVNVKSQRLAILLLLASWSHGSPMVITQLLSNSDQTESNCLSVLLEILNDPQDVLPDEQKSVASYLLLLAVIQLPAVRNQLIPVLQQYGDKFIMPMRAANQHLSMYFEDKSRLLLEEDFRRLVRDALPAAEEILKINLKPKSPSGSSLSINETQSTSQSIENESDDEVVAEVKAPTPPPPTRKSRGPAEKLIEKKKSAEKKSEASKEKREMDKVAADNRKLKDENFQLSSEVRKMTNQLDEYEAECRHYKDEMKNLSRQLDSVEAENERLRSKTDLEPSEDLAAGEVDRLKTEIRNYELKAQHQKIAMTNLEKSISTYHDKLEAIEGTNIEYRTKLTSSEETIQRLNSDIVVKNNKISQLEDVMRRSKQEVNQTSNISLQLESDRDELLEERESIIAKNRQLEDKIQHLETVLAQQSEFIEQNETELAQRSQADVEVQKLQRKMTEREAQFQRQIAEKVETIEKLEETLRNKRALISEKINLIDELKEIVQDNKETSQEFTLIISQQRQEIENLKSLLEQNNIEQPGKSDFKPGRTTSDQSSASTVVAGEEVEHRELDSLHLQQPIPAGVLLRIESTTSESNSDKPDPSTRQGSPKMDENMNIIEKAESMELGSEVRSDDEEMFSNRSSLSESRRPISMICPSSGADVSADGEGYDFDDVTETKRRKSKIELDRIRQLGEKQKIKEKSRERENPNESNKDGKDVKPTKIPSKVSESRVPPSQRNSKPSKPSKNGARKNDPKKKGSKSKSGASTRSKRK